jgi:hypothetical protein
MANVKISQLPSATTPLGGTEVLPIVQGGETKKVSVTNLRGTVVTAVSGTAPVVSSGGTTPAISMPAATSSVNGYLTSTDWNTFNNKQAAGAVTSVTGTAPVVSSGGATPAISMAAASGSANGYLTSTDWTTFNNKQPAGSYLTNGGALGTPSSGTATNLTGLPLSTGVTGLLPVGNGGTGTATPSLVAGTNVSITGTWPNQTINSTGGGGGGMVYPGAGIPLSTGSAWDTSYSTTGTGNVVLSTSPTLVTPILGTPTSGTLTNATGLPLTTGVTGLLPVANGGTGTATPALVAGTNVTITGSWPNQTINSSGGGGGSPGGLTTQVQYNNAGAFGGIANATTDGTTLTLISPIVRQNIQVISTNTTAVASRTYVFTATLTLTLPSSPTAGDSVMFANRSATATPVIDRNGQNIMGLAEDMTVNNVNYFGTLVYADATRGWIFQ